MKPFSLGVLAALLFVVLLGAVNTIVIPSADDQLRMALNQRARAGNFVLVDAEQKVAVVALKLAPAVTQADYPALKTAIEAIAGIQSVELLVDGQAPATIPAGDELRLYVEAHLRSHPIPSPTP